MKTLKTLFLILALVCAGNSFGQTKEETIEWLETNGLDIAGDTGLSYKIVNDTLSVWVFESDCLHHTYKVNLKDILFEKPEALISKKFECSKIKYFEIRTKKNKTIFKSGKKGAIEEPVDKGGFLFFYRNEENAKRVIKAIMHLAKLSGAKENKQTF
ncbi:hypothetical protein [Flavobacterium sp. MK4S-17]|jgi:hypothetical protein|uniref:hypothetical protein n=1 Tax=Flavobacterium sp. MK4S-17 TaxID=2543737 RepID=UPI00135A89AE|nr:hypothetical protein [Flavobacterium sp. MK4S-17]